MRISEIGGDLKDNSSSMSSVGECIIRMEDDSIEREIGNISLSDDLFLSEIILLCEIVLVSVKEMS